MLTRSNPTCENGIKIAKKKSSIHGFRQNKRK